MIDYELAKRRAMIAATGEALKLTADVPEVQREDAIKQALRLMEMGVNLMKAQVEAQERIKED
jgi:hypothetical protein